MCVRNSTRVDSADKTEVSDISPIVLAQIEDGRPLILFTVRVHRSTLLQMLTITGHPVSDPCMH
jgi:hypothetical protein